MPTWGAGSAQRGFTLLELLVVLAIMVTVIGIAPVAYDRLVPARRLQMEAERLADALRALRTHTQTENRAAALQVPGWAAREGFALELRESDQIVFFPDGSTSGGTLVLRSDAGERLVRVSMALGRVQVTVP